MVTVPGHGWTYVHIDRHHSVASSPAICRCAPSMAGGKAPRRRLRIAVLLDHLNSFSGGYEAQLRDAIHAACREAGHHLLLVYGGPVEAPQPLFAADNAIYDLLRPDSVDGIIVVSSLLSTYCGPGGVARLVARFAPARMCSIGIELPGVPSLVLDNRPGMEAVVEHLIRALVHDPVVRAGDLAQGEVVAIVGEGSARHG